MGQPLNQPEKSIILRTGRLELFNHHEVSQLCFNSFGNTFKCKYLLAIDYHKIRLKILKPKGKNVSKSIPNSVALAEKLGTQSNARIIRRDSVFVYERSIQQKFCQRTQSVTCLYKSIYNHEQPEFCQFIHRSTEDMRVLPTKLPSNPRRPVFTIAIAYYSSLLVFF